MGHPQPKVFVANLKTNNPTLRLTGAYVNARTPVQVKCKTCGYEWIHANPPDLAAGRVGCPSCTGRLPLTRERAQLKLDKLTNGTCLIESDFNSARDKVRVRCTVCDSVSSPRISALLHSRQKGSGCIHCDRKFQERVMSNRTYRFKEVTIKRRKFVLMGYEPQAIEWILDKRLASVADLVTGVANVPRIRYALGKREHYHYPDMWIPTQNRLVEVKSTYTLLGTLRSFRMAAAKRLAAEAEGYVYSLLLMSVDGTRIKLPPKWHTMKYTEIKALT